MGTIQLSFEIPFPVIQDFSPLEDFPFLLAQHADRYKGRYPEALIRKAILDNGMYELGESVSVEGLAEAAKRLHPQTVIAPDWMGECNRTLEATEALDRLLHGSGIYVGGVVQGKDLEERIFCFQHLEALRCTPICFPFRTPRDETIHALIMQDLLDDDAWYHLLGLQHLRELWDLRPGFWSVDTGKPFKGVSFQGLEQIRGLGRLDLEKPLTDYDTRVALWNIAYMRRLANL